MFFRIKPIFVSLSMLLLTSSSFGFWTVQESNEMTPQGKYKVGAEPQYRTSDGSGFNFTGFFDKSFSDALSARALIGTGENDFVAGASIKWVPFPDFDKQPALGLKVGGYLWKEASESFTTLRVEPIISKKFESSFGQLTPYAAIPVMFNSGNNFNKTSLQFAVGSELRHSEADNMTFGLEVAANAKDAFSYVAGFVTIYVDQNPQ